LAATPENRDVTLDCLTPEPPKKQIVSIPRTCLTEQTAPSDALTMLPAAERPELPDLPPLAARPPVPPLSASVSAAASIPESEPAPAVDALSCTAAATTTDGSDDAGTPNCDGPLPLRDYCDQSNTCSQSLEDRTRDFCRPDAPYYRSQSLGPNACSGLTLMLDFGLSSWRFDYDGTGKLRSVKLSDDVPSGVCRRFENVCGAPCELLGTAHSACGATPAEDPGIQAYLVAMRVPRDSPRLLRVDPPIAVRLHE
jgi:hypothetical protein